MVYHVKCKNTKISHTNIIWLQCCSKYFLIVTLMATYSWMQASGNAEIVWLIYHAPLHKGHPKITAFKFVIITFVVSGSSWHSFKHDQLAKRCCKLLGFTFIDFGLWFSGCKETRQKGIWLSPLNTKNHLQCCYSASLFSFYRSQSVFISK